MQCAEESELAEIQRRIPEELMMLIFSKLDPYSLGRAGIVCRQWNMLSESPRLWEQSCHEAFHLTVPGGPAALCRMMMRTYRFSWKRMFVHQPHLRFDGLFVSRNTYVRAGVVEFTNHKPVHLLCYYRYFRFLPDGSLMYRTSPSTVSKVARSMRRRGAAGQAADRDLSSAAVLTGRYIMRGTKVYCLLVYANSRATEVRIRLSLRSTHTGANNRLDVESIVTFDRELNTSTPVVNTALEPDEELAGGGGHAKTHSRGMAPCVFVPWSQVMSTPLNLPPQQMDFFVAG